MASPEREVVEQDGVEGAWPAIRTGVTFSYGQEMEPIDLEFQDISYTVKGNTKQGSINILQSCSGRFLSGHLCAVLGSSGSGKTTLLDVLAGVASTGAVAGRVLFNGRPASSRQLEDRMCYVPQSDVLLSTSTVREAIMTAALLRLPRGMTLAEKVEHVNAILALLDLEACADVYVGDDTLGIKGISGGQKRRTTIGVELIKNPSLLLADEPLTGLDSDMALTVANALARLAHAGRTVVFTVHQPSSEVVGLFQDITLLAYGRVAFAGTVLDSIDFFASVGHSLPALTNPMDFMIRQLRDPSTAAMVADHFAAERQALAKVHVLIRRSMRNTFRSRLVLFAQVFQNVAGGLLTGLFFLQLADTPVLTAAYNRTGCLYILLAISVFYWVQEAVLRHDADRRLLRRELGVRAYSPSVWFVSRLAWEIPLMAARIMLYAIIAYFMVGLQYTAAKFFIFYGVSMLVGIASDALGLICVVLLPVAIAAMSVSLLIIMILLYTAGFLSVDLPVYVRWVQSSSYMAIGLQALLQNEFEGLTLYTEAGVPVTLNSFKQAGLLVKDNGLTLGENVACLVGIGAGFYLLGWGLLLLMARLKRL